MIKCQECALEAVDNSPFCKEHLMNWNTNIAIGCKGFVSELIRQSKKTQDQ